MVGVRGRGVKMDRVEIVIATVSVSGVFGPMCALVRLDFKAFASCLRPSSAVPFTPQLVMFAAGFELGTVGWLMVCHTDVVSLCA